MADQDGFLKIEIGNKGGYITAEVLDGAFVRPAGRASVPAKVAGDDFMTLLELFELKPPIVVAAEEAVNENQGRGAAPLADEVQAYSSAPAAGLCAATSFC